MMSLQAEQQLERIADALWEIEKSVKLKPDKEGERDINKEREIYNFIIYYTSDDKEREQMKEVLRQYMIAEKDYEE